MKRLLPVLLFLLIVVSVPQSLTANERRFSYVYETSTLPQGAREIEIWNTYRTNRDYFYRRMDQRIEYEFGITDNLMSAFYLNASWITRDSNGPMDEGEELSSQSISISSEWKYKLMDRTADFMGMALYGEATLGLNEAELEGKLLFDKQVDNFLFAFNGVLEHEWESELENGETEVEKELSFEFDFGAAVMLSNSFALGIEARNHNAVAEGKWEFSALFAGPVMSYSMENWWATLTFMPQIKAFKGADTGSLVLRDHEKFETRLLLSFHL